MLLNSLAEKTLFFYIQGPKMTVLNLVYHPSFCTISEQSFFCAQLSLWGISCPKYIIAFRVYHMTTFHCFHIPESLTQMSSVTFSKTKTAVLKNMQVMNTKQLKHKSTFRRSQLMKIWFKRAKKKQECVLEIKINDVHRLYVCAHSYVNKQNWSLRQELYSLSFI